MFDLVLYISADDSATNILMKSSSVHEVKKSTSEELAFYNGTLLICSPAYYKNLAALTGFIKYENDWMSFCSGQNKVAAITRWPYLSDGRKAGSIVIN